MAKKGKYVKKTEESEKKHTPKVKKEKKKVEVILVKESSLVILVDGCPTTMKREEKHKDVSIGDMVEI